ncbi:hypothetical protein IT411_00710, partial [Candidatus Peregrinibacteria bacterium]|nr:hypothetical protein [Candidatus Peregrinibacteria bacterium]
TAEEINTAIANKPGLSGRELIGEIMTARRLAAEGPASIPIPLVKPKQPEQKVEEKAPKAKAKQPEKPEAPPVKGNVPEAKVQSSAPEPFKPQPFDAYKAERNAIARESIEVPRTTEVAMVGDLHGNGEIFVANMISLKIIPANADFSKPATITWTGGNRRVIFHGDILADRGVDSLQIMASLRKLQTEARAKGGEVVLLSGNHEDMALSFLMDKLIAGGKDPVMHNGFNMSLYGNQGAGLLEFIQKFSGDKRFNKAKSLEDVAVAAGFQVENVLGKHLVTDPKFPAFVTELGQKCLKNMQTLPEGKALLEQMTSMKVAEYIDDSLFLHTDPTPEMIKIINEYGATVGEAVDKINEIYQQGLRAKLLGQGEIPADFQRIANAFTDTTNRSGESNYKDVPLAGIKAKGVNRIIHGHSDYNGKSKTKDGVEITSVDVSAGKGGSEMDARSVGMIETNGQFTKGTDTEKLPPAKPIPPEIDVKLPAPQFVDALSVLPRAATDVEVANLNKLIKKGSVDPEKIIPLIGKKIIKVQDEVLDLMLSNADKDNKFLDAALSVKSLSPSQQESLIKAVSSKPNKWGILKNALARDLVSLDHPPILKEFLSDTKGVVLVLAMVEADSFVPNRQLIEKMASSRELWDMWNNPMMDYPDKVPAALDKEMAPIIKPKVEVYENLAALNALVSSPEFLPKLEAGFKEIEAGNPTTEVGKSLKSLREYDQKGYDILKENRSTVSPEIAHAIIDGNFVEHVNNAGVKVRAYIGGVVGQGGFGTVSRTSFTEGNSLKLKQGVIKRALPGKSLSTFAPEIAAASRVQKWDSPYINKALSIGPNNIIYETGANPQRFDVAFKGAPERQALTYLHQLVTGLQYYRDQNAFHADIKPANIMVMAMGNGPQVVIIDNTPNDATKKGLKDLPPRTPGFTPDEPTWAKIQADPKLAGYVDAHAVGYTLALLAFEKNLSPEHRQQIEQISKDCLDINKSSQPGFLKELQQRIQKMIDESPPLQPQLGQAA